MKSAFNETAAKEFAGRYPGIPEELALRIYTSRLIGRDPGLVLHGGGNTSVKLRFRNIVGEEQEILYVKGSGVDLASIEPEGFSGLKEYYRNRNLLKASVLSEHVGNAVVFFASNQTPTTGAALPVDGGIPAAFPR